MKSSIFHTFFWRPAMAMAMAMAAASVATMAFAATPDFTIVSPQNGAELKSPVLLRITVQNAQLGSPKDGLYHLHFSVDGGEEVALYRPQDVSLPLKPGMHVIAVELAGPNHRALKTSRKVSFMVHE